MKTSYFKTVFEMERFIPPPRKQRHRRFRFIGSKEDCKGFKVIPDPNDSFLITEVAWIMGIDSLKLRKTIHVMTIWEQQYVNQ